MNKYFVLCIFEKVIVYIWYCAFDHIWHFMEIFSLRQHLEYFNAETQAKNDQILQIKHIEAIEIYKIDHHTK